MLRRTLLSLALLATALSARPRVLARVGVVLSDGHGEPARWLAQLAPPPPLRAARRVLAPWGAAEEVPYEVALVQARVLWRLGDLAGAIRELEALLGAGPDDGRVWSLLAAIQDEQGDYPAAFRRCLPLVGRDDSFAATVCIASANRFGAQAASATASLEAALSRGPPPPDAHRRALLVVAELARTGGDAATAEAHLETALRLSPRDAEVLEALADLWLDMGRAAEVVRLLSPRPASPALQLRRALALRGEDPKAAAREARQLHAQVANALWGNQPRWAELDARLHLELLDEPEIAGRRAQVAWRTRRSPRAASIRLRAARATGDVTAEAEVRAWARDAGVTAPALVKLLGPGTP